VWIVFTPLPGKAYVFKGKSCHGDKRSKDRITVLVRINKEGFEKMPMVIAGKSQKPRCLKHIPVIYMQT
jgi:hypothetical protein